MNRLACVLGHLSPSAAGTSAPLSENKCINFEQTPIKWNGWGFADTEFGLNSKGLVALQGSRYKFSGKTMPALRSWMEEHAGLDIDAASPSQPEHKLPAPLQNAKFLAAIQGQFARMSSSDAERLMHAHGHTCQEIFALRYGKFERVPDLVVWPGQHEHVEAIVKAAVEHNIVLIPYGGGTSVSQALLCPVGEKRMIVSLDMHAMSKIKWINRSSMMACIEAGAVGQDIERELKSHNLVLGHEPDSSEFSTMGGWVATRASGMRKNKYGNIEDIVINIKTVTPMGTVTKLMQCPRVSTGPDLNEMVLGSEGTFGVVTEVIVKLQPEPELTRYGSIVFPDFESGVRFMREVALKRCTPVSVRLVDNKQFQFGQALKPEVESWRRQAMDKVKKWYVTKALKFDVNTMVAATLLFAGTKTEVAAKEAAVYDIAKRHGGMKAGEENGIRGYFLTYMIAYLRDFGFNYSFMAESFETSVPWENVQKCCDNVKERIMEVAKKENIEGTPFVSCRVTQCYDTGACLYFYFGFKWTGLKDPIATFSHVEHAARAEILRLGGSLSHHHGIGKLRKGFMPQTVGESGMAVLRGMKQLFDPTNVFASGNMALDSQAADAQEH